MTRFLLDTNVLIALLDANHEFHNAANGWFYPAGSQDWMSCPITENGAVRILSLPKYLGNQPPHVALERLRSLLAVGSHEQIPDDVSLLDADIEPQQIVGSAQVTDAYLLLLAHRHSAELATFDRRIQANVLRVGGGVYQIPA